MSKVIRLETEEEPERFFDFEEEKNSPEFFEPDYDRDEKFSRPIANGIENFPARKRTRSLQPHVVSCRVFRAFFFIDDPDHDRDEKFSRPISIGF